ncbi:hypothetical protein AB0C59_23240 [Streptomyces sp. NPDC048664]|uniref:SCO2102 family sporulation regulator n=1 Tax=Streptomyces sp. NPDC048664 TaxID=3154505 RepID=UPI00344114DD
MGLTVLYIAFGIVALWLLGEVLLQYKARLRWRLVAFAGFLGVVLGVLLHSVLVIALGAAAFTVGQTFVTLSFRRGFAAGWAVGNRREQGGGSKRRRGEPAREKAEKTAPEPVPEAAYRQDDVYDDEADDVFTPQQHQDQSDRTAAETTAVYEPQPLPEDTGSYGVYTGQAGHADQSGQQQQADQAYAYDGYTGYDQQQYGYDTGQQQSYAGYSDQYHYGTGTYDPSYGGQQQYAQQGYGQDQYPTGTYGETPAAGVWVPQQRGTEDALTGELPPEQQYPYQGDTPRQQGHGFDEQYRF